MIWFTNHRFFGLEIFINLPLGNFKSIIVTQVAVEFRFFMSFVANDAPEIEMMRGVWIGM